MKVFRRFALTLVFVTAFLPVVTSAETTSPPESYPDAVTLLTKVLSAHAHLGPAVITGKMMAVVPKSEVSLGIAFTRRQNDATHYTEVNRMVGEGMMITTDNGQEAVIEMTYFRSGGDITIWHGPGNTYEVTSADEGEQPDLALSVFAAGVKDRKRAAEWRKIPVTFEKLDGSDVYRVIFKGVRMGDEKRDVTVYVDPHTNLLRGVVLLDKKGGGLSYTWTFEQRKEPYPPETFVFTPPPGAKRTAPRK